MPTFAGRLLLRDEAPDGWLEVDAGRVVDWGEGEPEGNVAARGWIVPSPVNAHTHVADTFLRPRAGKPRTVAELVGPGGWKQRQLAQADDADVQAGIASYVEEMAAIGTAAFVDFREGGLDGTRILREQADALAAHPVIYGRPLRNDFNADEADELLSAVDGIGLSALRDFEDAADVEAWAEACHRRRRPFALHASEAKREDMGAVLALEPRYVVHATQATRKEADALAGARVPVVVCPRSNAHYGLRTPIRLFLDAGVSVAVGTDNGMLQDGDLLAELGQLAAWDPNASAEDLLRMATWNGRDLAGIATKPPRRGNAADWIVLPEAPFPSPADPRPGFVAASGSPPRPPPPEPR